MVISPFTTIITFVVPLIVCSQALQHNTPSTQKLPNISDLGTGPAYKYFVSGFVILTPQFLLIIIGRVQFLCQSLSVIHHAILYIIHTAAPIAAVFLLIVAIVSLEQNGSLHTTSAFGLFSSLASYCLLQTIVFFYLIIRRSKAPQHSNIFLPLWFLICCILLIICFSIWGATAKSIPEYIPAATPFLYNLGFVPRFWTQARIKRRNCNLSVQIHNRDEARL